MNAVQPVNTTYEPFSLEPEYIEANQAFIDRQSLDSVRRFLDLACGTGTVTELLARAAPHAHINGMDLDPVQIELISERFRKNGYDVRQGLGVTDDVIAGRPVATFGVGSADELPFAGEQFDCVTIFNAIHLLSDKKKFVNAVHRVLKREGRFGFNSTFYAGAIPPGGNKLYFEWLRLATEYVQERSAALVAQGHPPIRRIRGTTHAAFSNRWWSPREWAELLVQAGFRVRDVHERLVEVDHRGFALVGAYGGLAEVLMSGYPVEIASEALQACAKPAMDLLAVATVPRNYLEIWAVKP